MLDIKFIRENVGLIAEAARKKHIAIDLDRLLKLDEERRKLLASVEEKRAKQNASAAAIAAEADTKRRGELIAGARALKGRLQAEEERLAAVMKEWQLLMVGVPNIPDVSVPEGESDADNKEIRRVGTIPEFPFPPKSHVELMTSLRLADFERGAKIAGFRGYVLTGDGARLTYAIWRFVLDAFAKKEDYVPLIVPSLLRRESFLGTGYLPQGEEDLYRTQDGEYLAGTAEVATMGQVMDEVLERAELPKKYFAFSPCFRREAGSHGKDTKGVMRVHEFFKFEQVVLCEASHEESVKYHEEVTKNAEDLMKALEIPYRVVVNCGADLGLGQVKKYDIEAWVPSEGRFRETHSASYFHDFQTRRLNIRYRDADGKLKFAHSLNNTALATPRILVAILENNQREDGSVAVPKALRPYVGKDAIAT